ncbi:hypothetical protein NP233_g6964 [Leucocoprinus birnbaumii]|uniref:HAT C-terminal dimerisation domain-containing protein n=1 Tax=Leucocoprinus birnbaumii TaxID=56174 RepID=A0AAD5VTF0_9AGAR|nr:hypothetical protein NP233_g6964 [Leucocoprinus birnbaumii]
MNPSSPSPSPPPGLSPPNRKRKLAAQLLNFDNAAQPALKQQQLAVEQLRKHQAGVQVEEIADNEGPSTLRRASPLDPNHTLEATDGSNDNNNDPPFVPSPATTPPARPPKTQSTHELEDKDNEKLTKKSKVGMRKGKKAAVSDESAEEELERLMKSWNSAVYGFYKPIPVIDDIDGHHVHVFTCSASGCRHKVRWYLDKNDRCSTSNLHDHAKKCWGEEVVKHAQAIKDLNQVCQTVGKIKNHLNGDITAMFSRLEEKGTVTYSHHQHTTKQASRPMYCVPSAVTVGRDVWHIFKKTKKHISEMLQGYDGALSFATDGWTSTNHKAYIAVTVHLIMDGKPLVLLLDIIELPILHSGINLAHAFVDILKEFGIQDKVILRQFEHRKLSAMEAGDNNTEEDGGDKAEGEGDGVDDEVDMSDVDGLAELSEADEDGIMPVRQVLTKLHKLSFAVKNSSMLALPEWFRILERLDLRSRMIPCDITAINELTDNRKLELCAYELSNWEWKIAQQLCNILKVFKQATTSFSASTSSIAKVLPAMDKIDKVLTSQVTESTYLSCIWSALSIGAKLLNQYYELTDHSDVYHIATILHPSYKLTYLEKAEWPEEWLSKALEIHQNMFNDLSDLEKTSLTPVTNELELYLEQPREKVDDVLQWWLQRHSMFPRLSYMALDYHSIPATSIAVEPESTRLLLCLSVWFRSGSVDKDDINATAKLPKIIIPFVCTLQLPVPSEPGGIPLPAEAGDLYPLLRVQVTAGRGKGQPWGTQGHRIVVMSTSSAGPTLILSTSSAHEVLQIPPTIDGDSFVTQTLASIYLAAPFLHCYRNGNYINTIPANLENSYRWGWERTHSTDEHSRYTHVYLRTTPEFMPQVIQHLVYQLNHPSLPLPAPVYHHSSSSSASASPPLPILSPASKRPTKRVSKAEPVSPHHQVPSSQRSAKRRKLAYKFKDEPLSPQLNGNHNGRPHSHKPLDRRT